MVSGIVYQHTRNNNRVNMSKYIMIKAWIDKYIFFNKIPYPWREDAKCDYLWDYLKESEGV